LRFLPTGVIHVVTAVINRQGALKMITTTTEETGTAPATTAGEAPKPSKKASVAKRARHLAPAKAKSGKKATSAKKAPKSAKKAKVAKAAKPEARDGSKTARILDLLKRPEGVTAKELMKATDWLPHSIRGFLSGTVGKKLGLTVTSVKGEDGERSYSVKA
jgi:hypothetical protein